MTEIKDIRKYNAEYHPSGLVWKLIGEKVGKHGRAKKRYPEIAMKKIIVDDAIKADAEALEASRLMYERTGQMIPVWLNAEHRLIGGIEQYLLAKEMKLKMIPAQIKTKLTAQEKKELKQLISHKPEGNKVCPIYTNGGRVFVTMNQAKKFMYCLSGAKMLGYSLCVDEKLAICVRDKNGVPMVCGLSINQTDKWLREKAGDMK